MASSIPPAPKGLALEGRRLWRETLKEFTLGPAEMRLLEDACREVDLIETLQTELHGADLVVKGSRHQPVANPLLQEIRQHRGVLRQLLGALRLPDEDDSDTWSGLSTSERGRRAALARWRKF